MISFPPGGYEFVVARKPQDELFKALAHQDRARELLIALDTVVPTALAKSWLQKWNSPPTGTVLTYSIDHLVFRREPWVLEVEYASTLVGIHPIHLKRFKGIVENTLASGYCRRIIFWSEAGSRSLLTDLHSRGFQHKCEVIHLAVPPRAFVKKYGGSRIKLLFVGSGSSKGTFEWRGSGVFEAFAALCQRYKNLELVVRSDVPAYLIDRYGFMENLRVINGLVQREVMEREFQSADIFIFPSYTTAPLTILEAMSYELPTVTIDAWANSEYVEDGKTGLVVPRSSKVPYFYADTLQPNFLLPEFTEVLRDPDRWVVEELVRKISFLVENPELRKKLGKAARQEVEEGKFSLPRMNSKLARVFAEAIDGVGARP
jgi:glycosyltransferase involved in cell wall biosynthesis